MKEIPKVERVSASVSVPPSKSYTARALLLAALSTQPATIENALDCDDSRYMLDALTKIGFSTSGDFRSGVTVGPRLSMSAGEVELFVGNAGTAMRFLTGFLNFTPGRFILKGDSRMHQRPIGDLVDALLMIGGEVEYLEKENHPPIRIRGKKVRGGFEVDVAAGLSSQFVSALMLAAPATPDGLTVRTRHLSSRPYIEVTADVIRRFGGTVEEIEPGVFRVAGGELQAGHYRVEGDYSSASYWLAAAALSGGTVRLVGLEQHSAQGDRRIIDILVSLGCTARWEEDVLVLEGPRQLRGGSFDCNDVPDLVPTLAAIAPFASGPVELTNVGHLRVKESDRIETTAQELRKLGATVETGPEHLRIAPGYATGPVVIDPHEDHRIAMSMAIAGLRRGGVSIDQERVVSKSYPRFWKTLDELVEESGGAAHDQAR